MQMLLCVVDTWSVRVRLTVDNDLGGHDA